MSRKDVLSVRESFVPAGSRIHKSSKAFVTPRRVRRRDANLFQVLCDWVVRHQIGLSINLLSLLALVHTIFPRARRRTSKFIQLQYRDEATGKYSRGIDDVYMVIFWIVAFTGLRAAAMDYILRPLGAYAGVASPKNRTRLAEQAWMMTYYAIFWTLGMYIMYHSEHWFKLSALLSNFPIHKTTALMKWYYLVQFSFWLQQIFVINIEARRKDHWQMFAHHIFTSLLMLGSFICYQLKIGNAILCIMDLCDILLPLAKILKYLGYATACDVAFGVFLVAWFITRHILYNLVCWEIFRQEKFSDAFGCFESISGKRLTRDGGTAIWSNIGQAIINPGGPVCFNPRTARGYLVLLFALQVLTIIWFGMIVRVAYKVLCGKAAEDTRSDDEEEFDEDEEAVLRLGWDEKSGLEAAVRPFTEPIEQEVGADEVTGIFKGSRRAMSPTSSSAATNSAARSQKKTSARTSAISIPGHSDRKELLGRIGCDKPT